jgi:tetratricopeptide (TPR) repeat protein
VDLLNEILAAFAEAYDPAFWTVPTVVMLVGAGLGAVAAWRVTRTDESAVVDAESRRLDLEKRRETVVEAVRALDLERDKLAPEDYERERRALLAHGARAIRDLEEGDVSEDAEGDLRAAVEAARERLGDARADAIQRLLDGEPPPASPSVDAAPAAAARAPTEPPSEKGPFIGPRWEGALWTLAGVGALLALFLVLRGVELANDANGTNEVAQREGTSMVSRSAQVGPRQQAWLDALEQDPDDVEALNGLTDFELRRQNVERAREYNARALAAAPEDPDARTWAAMLEFSGGDPVAAVQQLDRIIAEAPQAWRPLYFRALIDVQIGRTGPALERLERAMELAEAEEDRFAVRRLLAEVRARMPAEGPELSGTITLAEGVDPSSWPENAAVFVSVRAASGPPRPLRAKKLPPGPFPLAFSLSAGDAPMGGGPLPDQVQLTVKVDLDGNPMGDDPGAPKVVLDGVSPGADPLEIALPPAG